MTGLYASGATCSNKGTAVYTSSYDAWGNVTSRYYSGTTAALSYDALDRFTQWNAGASNQEWYVYDSAGNRVLKRTTSLSGTSLTAYPFGMEEHAFTSTGTANGGDKYYYRLGGKLIGELNGTATQFFILDGLGSPLSSVNNTAGSAAIQGNQLFDPYGYRRYHSGLLGTSKQCTGQYNDGQTGLDYFNACYYDPVAGVFLSADSVQGNVGGMNPYAYVGGNPETASDPSGWVEIVSDGGGGAIEQGGIFTEGSGTFGGGSDASGSDTVGREITDTSTDSVSPELSQAIEQDIQATQQEIQQEKQYLREIDAKEAAAATASGEATSAEAIPDYPKLAQARAKEIRNSAVKKVGFWAQV